MTAPARRGQPLSLRLALLLSAAVLAVLLVTGLAVNRLVSRSLTDELTSVQRDRITLVAQQLEGIDLSQPRTRRAVEVVLQRMAAPVDGRAELRASDGTLLAAAGNVPAGRASDTVTEAVPGNDGWVLAVEVPRADQPFLRVFNLTLVIAGVLAVAVLMLVSTLLADRLTRPLRGVAAAAHRLGAGDLSSRAAGGPDRESAELADAFNAMAERLQRSEELRRRAASDMAHDLATPATVLESQLQAMVDGVIPADREQLERARSAASAMSGIIVQLRDLVDAEAAALQRRAERISVADLVAEAVRTVEPLFHEREVTTEIGAISGELAATADAHQAGRALRNVLTNAAQHSPPGSAVAVSAVAEERAVVIRVSDHGPGIRHEDVPHVFERFYRADPSRRREDDRSAARSGSGIGLTIARELLRANDGEVWVEQTGPGGTTFAIRLPAA
jgi:two-component system sensor histidine kinase BaeS